MKIRTLLLMVIVQLGIFNIANARDVIIGTDVVALGDNEANMFYQGRAFNHSAYRISGSSSTDTTTNKNTLTAGLGFRFYFDRYADSPYIEGDILFANNTNETGAKVGVDLRLGNIIIDPYISTLTRSYGVNIGLRL